MKPTLRRFDKAHEEYQSWHYPGDLAADLRLRAGRRSGLHTTRRRWLVAAGLVMVAGLLFKVITHSQPMRAPKVHVASVALPSITGMFPAGTGFAPSPATDISLPTDMTLPAVHLAWPSMDSHPNPKEKFS